jgi:hypothetical protein
MLTANATRIMIRRHNGGFRAWIDGRLEHYVDHPLMDAAIGRLIRTTHPNTFGIDFQFVSPEQTAEEIFEVMQGERLKAMGERELCLADRLASELSAARGLDVADVWREYQSMLEADREERQRAEGALR